MSRVLRSISEAADILDSDPMMEFLVDFASPDGGRESNVQKSNSKKTWLYAAASYGKFDRWKREHSKWTSLLALFFMLAMLGMAVWFVLDAFYSHPYSWPAIIGRELLLILFTCLATLFGFGILRDKETLAEKATRGLAKIMRCASTLFQFSLVIVCLVMLVLLVIVLYQGSPIEYLLRYVITLFIALLIIFISLGMAAFLYYPRTELGDGERRPRVMRRRLLLAIFDNFIWTLFAAALVIFMVFLIRKMKTSDRSSGLGIGDVVVDVFDVFIGVLVSGVVAANFSVLKIREAVMVDAARVIEMVSVLIRKVKTGSDWRVLGIGEFDAIDLVLSLEKILGESLCPQWCPLRASIESINYRTVLSREIFLSLGIDYRTLVPQFKSSDELLKRHGIEPDGLVAGVPALVRELELLNGQLKRRRWRPFVNN